MFPRELNNGRGCMIKLLKEWTNYRLNTWWRYQKKGRTAFKLLSRREEMKKLLPLSKGSTTTRDKTST